MLDENFFKTIQQDICNVFAKYEPKAAFYFDHWTSGLGQGISAVGEKGRVFEKGGVNFSAVEADALPAAATARNPHLAGQPFRAMGVSVVMHPVNPYAPTSHFNVRWLEVELPNQAVHWWIGGGFDLTPYYGFEEDCILWHQCAKDACDPFGKEIYPKFKKACDTYFYIKHRKEARGIGGIFFDDWNSLPKEQAMIYLRAVTDAYIKGYTSIIERRKDYAFGDRERDFQAYRRGRYVEFNLVYDRGTHFGLQSGGRAESILMSLPPRVEWRYNWQPGAGTDEARLYTDFLPARDWI